MRVYFDSSAFSKCRTRVMPTAWYFSAYKLSLTRNLQFACTVFVVEARREDGKRYAAVIEIMLPDYGNRQTAKKATTHN